MGLFIQIWNKNYTLKFSFPQNGNVLIQRGWKLGQRSSIGPCLSGWLSVLGERCAGVGAGSITGSDAGICNEKLGCWRCTTLSCTTQQIVELLMVKTCKGWRRCPLWLSAWSWSTCWQWKGWDGAAVPAVWAVPGMCAQAACWHSALFALLHLPV